MKKKIISLFTALVMVVGLVGIMPIAGVSAETSGDYEYEILDDGTVEITDYFGDAAELEIPDTIDGMKVTSIGSYALAECYGLTNVTISDSIESIKDMAFSRSYNLIDINVSSDNINYSSDKGVLFNKSKTELICFPGGKTDSSYTIPDSVTTINSSAFSFCNNLTSIVIPNSVTNIGSGAFFECHELTNVYIPNSVKCIESETFYGCFQLTNVIIPDSVTNLGDYAFFYCRSLKSITIPQSVTSIGDYVFSSYMSDLDITITCYKDSYAEQYAIDNGFDYELLDDEYLVTLEEIDINSDGKISTADVGLINAHAKGTKLLSGEALEKADINKDGKVSTADVGIINAYAKGTKKYA